jgi:hypothetical protein
MTGAGAGGRGAGRGEAVTVKTRLARGRSPLSVKAGFGPRRTIAQSQPS